MANILIAEDEARISRFIQKGLRSSGFTTTVVEDGVTALDRAASGEFDLMILDVGLPHMDGFQVLSVLRSMGSTMPVIMCTARDSVEDTVRGLDKGADDYLAKPFRFQELLARVNARLRHTAPAGTEEKLNTAHYPWTLAHGAPFWIRRMASSRWNYLPASSVSPRSSWKTLVKCSPVTSCWTKYGGMTLKGLPMWWTSMSGIYGTS